MSTLCVITPAKSQESQSITWYRADFPPANFVHGLMEGLGYNDQIQKFVQSQLPQYHHSTITAGYNRILHDLKSREGCTIGLLKNPESEAFLHYSVPSLLTFPYGLIIRHNDFNKFQYALNEEGYIALSQLINHSSLRFGVAGGRIYGQAIDQLLSRNKNNSNLVERRGEDAFKSLLQMMDKLRVDYILGYPEELQLYTSLHLLTNEMKFIPIQELPPFQQSYFVCSKTARGKELIGTFNTILLTNRLKADYLRLYQFWLDFDSRKRHQMLSEKVLSENSKRFETP